MAPASDPAPSAKAPGTWKDGPADWREGAKYAVQNLVFVGRVQPEATDCVFVVERQLGDWSLAGLRLQTTWDFFRNGRKLAPRLAAEAARRGQPVPKVRLPGEY